MSGIRVRRKVAIVGAGVAGLTLAVALDSAQYDVVLYEAQPDRDTGAALGLWEKSRRELTRLGVLLSSETDRRVVIHRLSGERLVGVPAPPVAQVMRPHLMQALNQQVPRSVRRVTQSIAEPQNLDADLVIGADGVRSRVRGLVIAQASQRVATPWVTLRGVSRGVEGNGRASGVAREFWGSDRLFGDAPLAAGERYWFTAHRSALGPEPIAATDALAEARTQFADASDGVRQVLAEAGDDTLATRLWTAPPMRRYRRGHYIVIGDAAHAALPNLGRGASDAILDATALARTLNTDGSLAMWEARRLAVTQSTRAAAGLGMRIATGPWWA